MTNNYARHQNSCGIKFILFKHCKNLKILEFREINPLKERMTNPILIKLITEIQKRCKSYCNWRPKF